jgi:predicted kinase
MTGDRRPVLYLFIGYPGAGKTTAAKAIARASGAIHIWTDQERRQRFGSPTHSYQESQQLYEDLNNRTAELLSSGRSVIFDTNFNFYTDREHLRNIAKRANAVTKTIWVTTPVEVAKSRAVAGQTTRNGYETNMSEAQFQSIVDHLDPPHQDEKIIKIDGSQLDVQHLLRQLGLV